MSPPGRRRGCSYTDVDAMNVYVDANRRDWRYLVDLIIQQARAGLRAEASRGYLGVLWWVIEPVMYMAVFYVAFAHVMKRGDENFAIFLLVGLIVWKWFYAALSAGANSLFANAGLMNLVYVPKIVFPLANIAVNTFKFLVILVLFLLFLQFTPTRMTWSWLLLPGLVLTQLLLIMALSCLLAAVMPFFPDLTVILNNVLTMLLFLSGIFFDISKVSASMQTYLMLNPIALLINMYRQILLEGAPPDWQQLLGVLVFSTATMALAIWLFKRFDRIYPKIVF